MKKIWKKLMVMGMLLCVSFMLTAVPVSAKKVSTSYVNRAKKSYYTFLAKNKSKYKWFKIVNAGVNGEPILMVANSMGFYMREDEKILTNCTVRAKLFYYTGSKVKAVKGGNLNGGASGCLLVYKKGTILVPFRRGVGTILKVKNGCTVGKEVIMGFLEEGVPEYVMYDLKNGKYGKRKIITSKVYDNYMKKWMPDSEFNKYGELNHTIFFKKNNVKNRGGVTYKPKKSKKSSTYKKAMKAYKKLLKKINACEFAVVDIDNDKIPELQVREYHYDSFFHNEGIMYYYKGKAYMEHIDGSDGWRSVEKIYKRGNIFLVSDMTQDGYIYYKLDKKNKTKVRVAEYHGNVNFRQGLKKKYYIHGKKVSKKAFKKFEAKINKRGEKKRPVYQLNTKKNRNRYLK